MSDYTKFVLPLIRQKEIPDPYAGERNVYEPGVCMRKGCGEPRWIHPERGELVLCEYHGAEVLEGRAKAPPLRVGIDYQSSARKVFFLDTLPGESDPEK